MRQSNTALQAIIALLAMLGVVSASAAGAATPMALQCGNLFDAKSARLLGERTIVTGADGRIQAVLPGKATAPEATIVDLAGQIGLDEGAFAACLASGRHREEVLADQKLATDLGLTGTPTFFIAGEKHTGFLPYEEWKRLLDEALAKAE